MALKNASVYLGKSKSGKGLILSGNDIDGKYVVSAKHLDEVIRGARKYVGFSKIVGKERK